MRCRECGNDTGRKRYMAGAAIVRSFNAAHYCPDCYEEKTKKKKLEERL